MVLQKMLLKNRFILIACADLRQEAEKEKLLTPDLLPSEDNIDIKTYTKYVKLIKFFCKNMSLEYGEPEKKILRQNEECDNSLYLI